MADAPTVAVFGKKSGTMQQIRNTPEELSAAAAKGYYPTHAQPPMPKVPPPEEHMEPHGAGEWATAIPKGIGDAAAMIPQALAGLGTAHDTAYASKALEEKSGVPERVVYNAVADPIHAFAEGGEASSKAREQGEGLPGQILAHLHGNPMLAPFADRMMSAGPAGSLRSGRLTAMNPNSLQGVTSASALKPVGDLEAKVAGNVLNPAKAWRGFKSAVQEHVGAGTDAFLKERMGHSKAVERTREANKQGASEHDATQEARERLAMDKASADATSRFTDAAEAIRQREAAESSNNMLEQRKVRLGALRAEKSEAVAANAKLARDAERATLDDMGHVLRGLAENAEVNPGAIFHATEAAKSRLVVDPTSLKLFNDIMRQVTEEDAVADAGLHSETGEAEAVPKEAMPFDRVRTMYTAVVDALTNNDLPYNVRKGLEGVRAATDNALRDAIKRKSGDAGVLFYDQFKSRWADHSRTWRDQTPLTKGGSPLTYLMQLLDSQLVAKDQIAMPDTTMRMLLDRTGKERIGQLLERKRQYGARPTLFNDLQNLDTNYRKAVKMRPQKLPMPHTDEAFLIERSKTGYPKPVAVGSPENITDAARTAASRDFYKQLLEPRKEFVPKPEPPTPDPVDFRRRRIIERTKQPFRLFDDMILFPRGLEHGLLKNSRIREALANHPRNEQPLPPGYTDPNGPPEPPGVSAPPRGLLADSTEALKALRRKKEPKAAAPTEVRVGNPTDEMVYWNQAKRELGSSATISAVAKRAQELKEAAKR